MKYMKSKNGSYRKNRMRKKGNTQSFLLKNLYDKKEEVENALYSLMERQRNDNSFDDSPEEFDRAENEISSGMYYGLIDRKNAELKKIEKLIHRIINNNDFGYCEECGERIDPNRLIAMPDATLCISCQRELEKPGRSSSYSGSDKGSKWKFEQDNDELDDNEILDDVMLKQEMGSLSLAEMDEIEIDEQPDDEEDDLDEDDFEPDTKVSAPES